MRIANITIPENKHLDIALTVVYGIGRNTSQSILNDLNIPYSHKVPQLKDNQINEIRTRIEKKSIEGTLRRSVSSNIKRMRDIKCYKGTRHASRLPVRGQRTRVNARTRKGVKITMGSGRVKLQKK